MTDICFEIKTDSGLVRAAILLLRRDKEDHRIEIREIIMIGPAKNHIFIQADIQPWRCIDTQVMNDRIFFWILIIARSDAG